MQLKVWVTCRVPASNPARASSFPGVAVPARCWRFRFSLGGRSTRPRPALLGARVRRLMASGVLEQRGRPAPGPARRGSRSAAPRVLGRNEGAPRHARPASCGMVPVSLSIARTHAHDLVHRRGSGRERKRGRSAARRGSRRSRETLSAAPSIACAPGSRRGRADR